MASRKIDRYRITRKLGEGDMGVVCAAASVSHPNVCQLYEIGEADAQLYLLMEGLEGKSLASRLERGPIRTPRLPS